MTKLFDENGHCAAAEYDAETRFYARAARGAGKTRRGFNFWQRPVAKGSARGDYVGFELVGTPNKGVSRRRAGVLALLLGYLFRGGRGAVVAESVAITRITSRTIAMNPMVSKVHGYLSLRSSLPPPFESVSALLHVPRNRDRPRFPD